ncbi:MAG: hypothetical protein QW531_03355, partial [Thermoplasmata archaeon]
YKGLQKIEQGFRVLKSEFFLRPVYHWTERRVVAHIFLCVMALLVKWLLEKEYGKEKIERILETFSYIFETRKGVFEWVGSE